MATKAPIAAPRQAAAATSDVSGFRTWFSAADLAELGLPGMPGDKRSITRRAQEDRWSLRSGADGALLVRPRQGRGGGLEFHVSLLPAAARLELVRRGICAAEPQADDTDQDAGGWRWFEQQPTTVRRGAGRRLGIINEIEVLEQSGLTRTAAIAEISAQRGVGKSTLWAWLNTIEGVAAADRLPAIAPRRKGGGCAAEMDPLLWSLFKSDYLRLSAPTMTSCYERTATYAAENGLSMASERTFRRRVEREVDPRIIKLRREGEEALRRSIPAQRRTVDHLRALEHVNVDGHKFDVFVTSREGKVIRPMMVAIQDIHSSKILAWRVAETECAALARLAFADLFRNFGIPRECTLDNGRGFASKWITGGTKTRFRFKIRDEEPTGLLVGLGIKVHWALPYRGQSKPIERAFRDMCDHIAKHPAMEGAYTGNTPMAKPENYGSRAIQWDTFVAHVDAGIAAHNARLGRRGRSYAGRSFDQVFEESYKASPVGKATPEQLRMALLAADQKMVNRQTGEIELHGNRYWSPECGIFSGQRVTVRFDPENLHDEIHVYSQDGSYLTSAQLIDDTGFGDIAGARATGKRLKDYRSQIRAGAEAENLMAAEELAARLPSPARPAIPEPGAIRPVRHSGSLAVMRKPEARPQPRAGEAPLDRMRGAVLRLVDEQ
ncbi:transposase domain-containing protein [Allopontixanthobacter sp.]|uniref:transposase domain-containing protein n=1 Tax=Allopontixanthobacter sp. TaxID=2906452 RepID=UPI002AB93A16|nr:transposase domain-containing protein [Allopontixanthobacter sp.]MDZ4308404.1 transposase domain-containing protein [Allopontixanthobacter sp.]